MHGLLTDVFLPVPCPHATGSQLLLYVSGDTEKLRKFPRLVTAGNAHLEMSSLVA